MWQLARFRKCGLKRRVTSKAEGPSRQAPKSKLALIPEASCRLLFLCALLREQGVLCCGVAPACLLLWQEEAVPTRTHSPCLFFKQSRWRRVFQLRGLIDVGEAPGVWGERCAVNRRHRVLPHSSRWLMSWLTSWAVNFIWLFRVSRQPAPLSCSLRLCLKLCQHRVLGRW